MKFSLKSILPHLIVILGFIIIALAYFYPVLQGKQIRQSDIVQYTGMAKQQNDFRLQTGEETYWTNSAFGGMPTYQLGAQYPHNYIKELDRTLRFLPRPADYLFLYLLGFYILLIVLKVDYKLAAIGAIAFGFSTYLITFLGVGHNSKAHAIAYMPLVLSGIILAFRKKYVLGFIVTALAMALELSANHFQMTYYLMLLVIVLGVSYLIDAYRKKLLPHFFKTVGLLILAVILAIGLNATNIMATQEYVKESTRSQSELSINADGTPKEASSGLTKEYITEYSNGFLDTFSLFIPRFLGGGSYEDLGKESKTYDAFRKLGASPIQALQESQRAPTYWGQLPIIEAPAYIGAVIIFLFVLSLFLVKGRLKWWLLGGTILSLLLSYGKNLDFLTDFFIDYVPLYNKFRAVSSIQVILELCVPVLAIFGVSRLLNDFEKEDVKMKALIYATGITGGLAFIFLVFKGTLFDFSGTNDNAYIQAYGADFIEAVRADRMSIFTKDTLRSLVLVVLAAGVVWSFLKNKLTEVMVVVFLGILITFDLVTVDKRYVSADDFVSAIQVQKPFQPTQADQEILRDDGHFRVFDMTTGSTRPSYFHNSLNGYHAAKMRRYNELFDFHIVKQNLEVLNMLNTKYIIGEDENRKEVAYGNPDANGNAWFIEDLKIVDSPDQEIRALDSINTKTTAVILKEHLPSDLNKTTFEVDSSDTISLSEYRPNYLKYISKKRNDGFAVFSENYYKHGWIAFIDGESAEHVLVNYVLRGMEVPSGEHIIEFKFEPQVVDSGAKVALGSSLIMLLIIFGGIYMEFRNKT
ncbi:MAG: hypothetical protein HKO00_00675 [Flavobacteriaceae bacterium]|nr:hypothetical protein [Flavobacteriaceae bacterium]